MGAEDLRRQIDEAREMPAQQNAIRLAEAERMDK
jgi:hypothetical protein